MSVARDLTRLEPRRVCLIKPSSLGDVVHATPVLAALRDRWPQSHFAWVVNRGLSGLIDHLPQLDDVIPFDRARMRGARGMLRFVQFLAELRRKKFDLTIDLQGLLRSALMARATGAAVRVGVADAREGATHLYTHRVAAPADSHHAVDRLMAIAAAFGAAPSPPRFLTNITQADAAWADNQLGLLNRPRIIFNLGARWLTKRWPPAAFAEVARRASAHLRASVIVVGAPEDREAVDAFRQHLGAIPVVDLCGATTLGQLAAVAQRCELFVSNDSGPMHLATAAGAPVIGIFTCTDPQRTGPYGANASVVRSHIWCAASLLKKCDRLECMTELAPIRVWTEVARRLAQAGWVATTAA